MDPRNTALFGSDDEQGMVAVEWIAGTSGTDHMRIFVRDGSRVTHHDEPFEPFIVSTASALDGCPVAPLSTTPLTGTGALNTLATFAQWKPCRKAAAWLAKETGYSQSQPGAPYLCPADPVQQYLIRSGKTHFMGMPPNGVNRMQVDIECVTTPGYDFCNAERPGDEIVAIAMADLSGWVEVLSGSDMDEATMLQRFVACVQERDPDVIEGHNIFNFDLPYIAARAAYREVALTLGRDGSTPQARPSRMSIGERTLSYTRFDIFGRHVVDTLFLVHAYDVAHRSLSGFGLKEVAIHFGVAAADRTYVEGSCISALYREDPARIMRYVRDDVCETRAISTLLSQSSFVQAQTLPYSYQNICVRGTATKVDALMLREYLRREHALPHPDMPRQFAGGYTDVFHTGVIRDVHHCDVRSLYPSLMLTRQLAPRSDECGVFLQLLETLRDFRLEAKASMQAATDDHSRAGYDALQTTFKILINSFYGYLGFGQARFSDFDAAETITADGRELLQQMIDWLKAHDADPVEIDTDGIYFVPPSDCLAGAGAPAKLAAFRAAFSANLPAGIDVEFDGEYTSMYSYKMKNYALLAPGGEVTIKGGALKSRGLEPFQRAFVEEMIRLRLEGREADLPALRTRYEHAIQHREWPIEKLAKREMLQESPKSYAGKIGRGARARSASYELALKSARDYRAGDHVSYYVSGEKKSIPVHQAAKLVAEWDPAKRDENVAYYLAKLVALCKKFEVPETMETQGELF
ncbi:MAG: DNA polymerase II [Verrucomicrobia bacterium]|jgi:DNA polymerase, archaea type|nr:DNA polymerase II [Verrucomicrobiota bacterium]MBT7066341.1 DNA polymerase II [Verrucomicrobiota bacterium]MBT7699733.1 DNA polymerase II [Verrucomicrobiota bacterium]